MNTSLYEAGLSEAKIEHKEPVIVGFFILHYAKLRMLELYYNFFTRFCDVNKFEELEMDTGSLHPAVAEKDMEDCIQPEMKTEGERLWSKDCSDSFTAVASGNLFSRISCDKHKRHDEREPGLFKEEFRCRDVMSLQQDVLLL